MMKFLIKYYIKKELLNLKGLKLIRSNFYVQTRPASTNLVKNKRFDQIGTCVKLTGRHHNTYTVGGSNWGIYRSINGLHSDNMELRLEIHQGDVVNHRHRT